MTGSAAPVSRGAGEDVTADYDALVRGAGAVALSDRRIVRVTGDDRAAFLHGMCSNDVNGAAAGTVLPALLLTEHAHLIADFFAWVRADSILLEIDADLWAPAREHLERLLVADDVEFEEDSALAVIDVEGPRAVEAIGSLGGAEAAALSEWRHQTFGDLAIANLPRLGAPAFTILAPAARSAEIVEKIAALGGDFRAVGRDALEIVRVENGIARVGIDTTPKTIALEARLERAISFTKGCYVGQETIERATARGGVKKRLLGLKLEARGQPAAGAAVRHAGKEVGRIGSIATSPRIGVIALAILQHSAWGVGARVEVEGDGEALVSELPFRKG
jgi:folate-binding protein YgfZ